jgi:hypothetical protein
MATTDTVTLLFSTFADQGELLGRPERTVTRQIQVFEKLVNEAVATCGGREAQWLGDGMMAVFRSAGDAVRCAVAVQQSGRCATAGWRGGIRVGLQVGETPSGRSTYGVPLLTARKLCERASAGQILCSELIAGLLSERHDFSFHDLPKIESHGDAVPIAACQVVYERDDLAVLLRHTPFVGRSAELRKLENALTQARTGRGGLVMLAGEPGIGKTRMIEEFTEVARAEEALVLWGRCYEGEWAPPFGPFAEALAGCVKVADLEELRTDLGFGAPPLSRLVPTIRERLSDVPEPEALQPDEERFRLLDAVSQFLIAVSARHPVVLVLDDLHWADKGTIAMLRHLARFLARSQVLVIGAYRDVELDRQHPFAESLGALRRESNYERIVLKGLGSAEIAQLLEAIAEADVPEALVTAIGAETAGNPFFIREVLLHLVEEGKIFREDGQWTTALATEGMGIPEGVRQVIGKRLSRLSAEGNRLLSAACVFNGAFHFQIAATAAGLDDEAASSALDEALGAQLIRSSVDGDTYDFTHALIRHTLYAELNPSRQVRMHRLVADAMEHLWGDRSKEHAAELTYQFARSAALPGADRGGEFAIEAANCAETAYAHDEVVALIRIALDLLPIGDTRRPQLLGRLGLALAWTLNFEEALRASREAGKLIADAEGDQAATVYLRKAISALDMGGFERGAWALAKEGLRYSGERRDAAWVLFEAQDLGREEDEDANDPGLAPDSQRLRDLLNVAEHLLPEERREYDWLRRHASRAEILADPDAHRGELLFRGGEYRRCLPLYEEESARCQKKGQIAMALVAWAGVARCHTALGDFGSARAALDRATVLSRRLTGPSFQMLNLIGAKHEMRIATDEGWQKVIPNPDSSFEDSNIENRWAAGAIRASVAYIFARLDRPKEALRLLATVWAALEISNAFAAEVYTPTACDTADTLWLSERTDHIEVIERNIREKVIGPDFRWPMRDARLSIARLCALQGRYGEAIDWFAKARVVLEEQGARPLRAIADFDEAFMFTRRRAAGDEARARPLLDAAIAQFQTIGMTGWLRRAEALVDQLKTGRLVQPASNDRIRGKAEVDNLFRREGDIWTITYEGHTLRLKDFKGLSYIARLLEQPGEEFPAASLVTGVDSANAAEDSEARAELGAMTREQLAERNLRAGGSEDAGEMIDAQAKAAYRRKLEELREELEEAREFRNPERVAKAEDEIEALSKELSRGIGRGGRHRRAGSTSERARLSVTSAIKVAIERVAQKHSRLAAHLSASIRTGTYCSYRPDPQSNADWHF